MRTFELIEKYNNNDRIDIAKAIEAKPYISIELKQHMARLVLNNCTEVVNGNIYIDSVDRYILFTIAVIGAHTNLEFDYDENDERSVIDDYDDLCESGLLVKIIDTFKDDYAACQEVLNMITADIMQYSMTIEDKIGQFLDGIHGSVDGAIKLLVDKLNLDDLAKNSPLDSNALFELYNSIKEK